jgi:hypothetical protein
MAAERNGTLMVIFLVSCVVMFTSLGKTWEYAGTSKTSSNVSPSPKNLGGNLALEEPFIVAMCKDRGQMVK